MRTLIYKRTHCGDPDPETGVFGNNNCMGRVRSWQFGAVIGVGGVGKEPQRWGIAGKVTWIGIGPDKTEDSQPPKVTFDHFRYYGQAGASFEELAPTLARRMYDKNVRVVIDKLSDKERSEVEAILRLAEGAPPSKQRKSGAMRTSNKVGRKC